MIFKPHLKASFCLFYKDSLLVFFLFVPNCSTKSLKFAVISPFLSEADDSHIHYIFIVNLKKTVLKENIFCANQIDINVTNYVIILQHKSMLIQCKTFGPLQIVTV